MGIYQNALYMPRCCVGTIVLTATSAAVALAKLFGARVCMHRRRVHARLLLLCYHHLLAGTHRGRRSSWQSS